MGWKNIGMEEYWNEGLEDRKAGYPARTGVRLFRSYFQILFEISNNFSEYFRVPQVSVCVCPVIHDRNESIRQNDIQCHT